MILESLLEQEEEEKRSFTSIQEKLGSIHLEDDEEESSDKSRQLHSDEKLNVRSFEAPSTSIKDFKSEMIQGDDKLQMQHKQRNDSQVNDSLEDVIGGFLQRLDESFRKRMSTLQLKEMDDSM